MCAIVDASVVGEIWDQGGNAAGQGFRRAIENGKIPLVIGGTRLAEELSLISSGKPSRMKSWIQELQRSGLLRRVVDSKVDELCSDLASSTKLSAIVLRSDDHHIIALAQLSGARLLYTNDQKLTSDFRDPQVVTSPRGSVYSTRKSNDFSKARRLLLARKDLCVHAT